MDKKYLGKFLAGVAVGAVVGIKTKEFMDSEKGQKAKMKMQKTMDEFYAFMSPKLEAMKSLGKAKYKEVVISAAVEYGKIKKLSDKMIDQLVKDTLKMWDDFSGEE